MEEISGRGFFSFGSKSSSRSSLQKEPASLSTRTRLQEVVDLGKRQFHPPNLRKRGVDGGNVFTARAEPLPDGQHLRKNHFYCHIGHDHVQVQAIPFRVQRCLTK
jgi:hypothetical protein